MTGTVTKETPGHRQVSNQNREPKPDLEIQSLGYPLPTVHACFLSIVKVLSLP